MMDTGGVDSTSPLFFAPIATFTIHIMQSIVEGRTFKESYKAPFLLPYFRTKVHKNYSLYNEGFTKFLIMQETIVDHERRLSWLIIGTRTVM